MNQTMLSHVIMISAISVFVYSLSTIAKIIKDCWLQRARHKLREEERRAIHDRARRNKNGGDSTLGDARVNSEFHNSDFGMGGVAIHRAAKKV